MTSLYDSCDLLLCPHTLGTLEAILPLFCRCSAAAMYWVLQLAAAEQRQNKHKFKGAYIYISPYVERRYSGGTMRRNRDESTYDESMGTRKKRVTHAGHFMLELGRMG